MSSATSKKILYTAAVTPEQKVHIQELTNSLALRGKYPCIGDMVTGAVELLHKQCSNKQ